MSDTAPATSSFSPLTPRQQRLRRIVVIILFAIAALSAFGLLHPFFRLTHQGPLTKTVRRALAVKGVLILGYWSIVFLLALALIIIAWLDIGEIRKKLAHERADILRRMAEQSRSERKRKRPKGANGADSPGGTGHESG